MVTVTTIYLIVLFVDTMNILKQLITYSLYPVIFVAAMIIALWGISLDFVPELIVGSIAIGTMIIVAVGERVNPEYADWNKSQDDVKTDIVHMLVSMVLIKKVLEFIFSLFLFSVAIRLAEWVGFSLWPVHWHLIPQLLLAMLLHGFVEYWWHRWSHELPILWRLHATHHSPGRLYWVNAGRFHPLDTMVSYIITAAPMILLGANTELFILVAVWENVHGLFQHCNIHLKLGPLNWIFSMAELHRWHHSRKLEEANANYGNNIIFWDLVFGTFFFPKDRDASEYVGLSGMDKFPKDYVGQLVSPFKWKAIEKAGAELERTSN